MRINPKALQVIRERSGFSQAELARISKVGQGYISQLEKGEKNPSPATVQKLAKALACPAVAFLWSEAAA